MIYCDAQPKTKTGFNILRYDTFIQQNTTIYTHKYLQYHNTMEMFNYVLRMPRCHIVTE